MSINPPKNLVGVYQNKPTNACILQVKLTWEAPDTGGDDYDKFYIYRNDVKIGDVEKTIFEYFDESIISCDYSTYWVASVDTTVEPKLTSVPSNIITNYSLGFEELLTRLRRLLMDSPTDPRMQRWTDEDLIEYINISIGDINATPPNSNYNLTNIPSGWTSLILTRARFEAWLSRSGLEVAKEFNFGFGGVSLQIDRSQKYLSISDKAWQAYNERLTKAKLANLMGTISPLGILSADLSFRIRTYAPRQYRVR